MKNPVGNRRNLPPMRCDSRVICVVNNVCDRLEHSSHIWSVRSTVRDLSVQDNSSGTDRTAADGAACRQAESEWYHSRRKVSLRFWCIGTNHHLRLAPSVAAIALALITCARCAYWLPLPVEYALASQSRTPELALVKLTQLVGSLLRRTFMR